MAKPILLIGEAWGEAEAKLRVGFVGASGVELLHMLAHAEVIKYTNSDRHSLNLYWRTGDSRHVNLVWKNHAQQIHRTNVFNLHPPGNRLETLCGSRQEGIPDYAALLPGKYALRRYQAELDRLGDEILSLDPNLIICLGNAALWALTGHTGVRKYRGTTITSTHCVAGFKLLVCYHPSAILRQPTNRATTVADLSKAVRESQTDRVVRPPCAIWTEPNLDDIASFFTNYVPPGTLVAVDVETIGTRITCIGFAPRRDLALVIPLDDPSKPGKSYWPNAAAERECWELIRAVLEDRRIRKVFQNGLYDVAFLIRSYGIRVYGCAHDTMLLHHALQPESPKALGYLGSLYTDHGPWKSERKGTSTIKRDE